MRPIDADVLKNKSRHVFKSNTGGHCSPIVSTDDIDNTPTLTLDDIMPHGQWIEDEKGEVICSKCGIRIPEMYSNADSIIKSECRFCHSCGAKMDGKE